MEKKIFMYDFDGTLTPFPVTKVKILEECGYVDGMMDPKFELLIEKRMMENGVDLYTASYQLLLEVLNENNIKPTSDKFSLAASDVEYNPGVYEFLDDITKKGFCNYLISSSAKPFLEKTKIAKFFKDIFATTFKFDESGVAFDIDFLMTDEVKVDVIKEILKINGYDDCKNFVYVGDGLTDIPAMEYVKNNGGTTIFVYLDEDNESYKMACDKGVITYSAKADYNKGSELNNIIDKLCFK